MRDSDGELDILERGIFSRKVEDDHSNDDLGKTKLDHSEESFHHGTPQASQHAQTLVHSSGASLHDSHCPSKSPWKWQHIDSYKVKCFPSPVVIEYIARMSLDGAVDIPLFMDKLPLCRQCDVRIWMQADHPVILSSTATGVPLKFSNTSKSKQWRLIGIETAECSNLNGIRLTFDFSKKLEPVLYRQDDAFAVTIFKPPFETVEAIEPHKVLVWWDASGSHFTQHNSHTIPLFHKLLSHWVKHKAREELDLIIVPFSNKKHKYQRFRLSCEADTTVVLQFLKTGIWYNGVSKVECLFNVPTPLERNANFCVLFSDAGQVLHSHSESTLAQKLHHMKTPVFSIAISKNRNAVKLRHISHCTGGKFVDSSVESSEDIVEAVGKPVFSLTRLVFDSEKIEQIYPSQSIPIHPNQPVLIVGRLKPHTVLKDDCKLEAQFGFGPLITDRIKFNIRSAEGEYAKSSQSLHSTDYASYFTSYLEINSTELQEEPMRNFVPCLVGDISLAEIESFPSIYKDDIITLSKSIRIESMHTFFSKQGEQGRRTDQSIEDLKHEWNDYLDWYSAQMKHNGDVQDGITTKLLHWVEHTIVPTLILAMERAEAFQTYYLNAMMDFQDSYIMDNDQYTTILKDAYPSFSATQESNDIVEKWINNAPLLSQILSQFSPWNPDSAIKTYEHVRQWQMDAFGFVHPSIYSEIGHLFMRKGLHDEGLCIFQNILESFPRSSSLFPSIGRSVALMHLYHGHERTACEIYWNIAHSYPSENPLHLIELAQCLDKCKDVPKCIEVLIHVISTDWQECFGSVRVVALRELNRIIFTHKNIKQESFKTLDSALIRHTPLDLRIVLSCDTDPLSAIYEIVEPAGRIVSLEDPFSQSTGAILCGVGIEEYLLPRSLHSSFGSSQGTYTIRYATEQQSPVYKLLGSSRIYCRVYKSFQRQVEQLEDHLFQVKPSSDNSRTLLKIRVDKNVDLWTQSKNSKESAVCTVS
eukprot:CAMPEP_0117440696 /NCGR_PEP_ID=MMETSP0759-20121206/3231_1 /TAXON_ID=63605 /ORGANISM="Percolomonas cosmopolitus, Strain WS" /LENGTH=980 /DNA_ID=CAMNT_0005232485 /DNA_START=193 /DNA_END=3135 /DNA_ORIENTATION=-